MKATSVAFLGFNKMALNFREKLASVLIVGYLILIGAGVYISSGNNFINNEKKIDLNNKKYLVRKYEEIFNTFYNITSPPTNLDIPPKPGASFEYYVIKVNNNGVILYSYKRFNNDSLEAKIDGENDPEFEVRQDTSRMLIEKFENGK